MRRLPLLVATALMTLLAPRAMLAQGGGGGGPDETPSNPWNDGLVPGDYVRMSAGSADAGEPARRAAAFGIAARRTTPAGRTGTRARAASAASGSASTRRTARSRSNAPLFIARLHAAQRSERDVGERGARRNPRGHIGVTTRCGCRVPYIMPNMSLGLGFIDWQPGEIKYEATTGSGTAKQQHRVERRGHRRRGARQESSSIASRVFGEALYVYGYTSFGSGFARRAASALTRAATVPQRQHDARDDSRRLARSRRPVTPRTARDMTLASTRRSTPAEPCRRSWPTASPTSASVIRRATRFRRRSCATSPTTIARRRRPRRRPRRSSFGATARARSAPARRSTSCRRSATPLQGKEFFMGFARVIRAMTRCREADRHARARQGGRRRRRDRRRVRLRDGDVERVGAAERARGRASVRSSSAR